MQALITGWKDRFYQPREEFRKVYRTWISPDQRFAVAELFPGELFVAGKLLSLGREDMVLEFLGTFSDPSDTPELKKYEVDWSCLPYGFIKFQCSYPETLTSRSERCYFDRDLYRKMYQKCNGIPYSGHKFPDDPET